MTGKTITSTPVLGLVLILLVAALGVQPATAGGALETADITGFTSTFPPFFDGKLIPIRWDPRCLPVGFTYFDDGVNEPPGAAAALSSGFASWNAISTSYISMGITNTVAAPGNPFGAFDFVNEINFDAFGGFLAAAPSVALIADTTFVAGMDIDGDGDSDVDASIGVCADADGDGDFEFPPGFYRAGTILDNDVFFNGGFVWTSTPTAAPDVDIEAVAVHEFGHSHGLSHSMIDQFVHQSCDGDNNGASVGNGMPDIPGGGATMFPFIDITDPAAELSQRSIEEDDIAWSSLTYPEGSAASGPAALQAGDVDFNSVYGVLEGEVFSGAQGGAPVAGASVQACDQKTGVVAEGFSGTTQVGVFVFFGFPADVGAGFFLVGPQSFHILDGKYRIPLRKGGYEVFLEALDGFPAGAGNISVTAILGSIFGQLTFEEEFWRKGAAESAFEADPGKGDLVQVKTGQTRSGVDFVTNVTARLAGAGPVTNVGFTGSPGGRQYAVRFPGGSVLGLLGPSGVLHTGRFFTFSVDASVAPVMAEVTLAGASVDGTTGNLVIEKLLHKEKVFVGQGSDSTPYFFPGPEGLSDKVRAELGRGKYDDLALILELPAAPFPGVSAVPPLVGLSSLAPSGNAFISDDGGATFTPVATFDFLFDLVATP